jgi:hypothetical protein
MAVNWYLEVESPTIGALNAVLNELGIANQPFEGGRLGYEIHRWSVRAHAQDAADALTARGYRARVEAFHA